MTTRSTGAGRDGPARPADDVSIVEAEREQFQHEARRIAAGGWQRAVIGVAIGAAVGAGIALVLPREEGPRRRTTRDGRPAPFTS